MAKKKHEFHVIIEKDEDDFFIGSIPELKGCHTQAKSLDELMTRIKEAAELQPTPKVTPTCLRGHVKLLNRVTK